MLSLSNKFFRGLRSDEEKKRVRGSFSEARNFREDLERVLLHEIEILRRQVESDDLTEGNNYHDKLVKKLSEINAYKSVCSLIKGNYEEKS